MSRPSTQKPTAGRDAEGIDRTMQGVYRRLPENIRLLMAKYDVDPAEVAAALNIAKRTFGEKRRTPWDLSRTDRDHRKGASHRPCNPDVWRDRPRGYVGDHDQRMRRMP